MSGRRTGYVVALVVAVVVLLGSVGAVAWGTSRPSAVDRQVSRGYGDGWSGGRAMMDGRQRMMGDGGTGRMWDGGGMGRMWGDGGTGRMWDDDGTGALTLDQARDKAQTWVDEHLSGARLDNGVAVMRGYRFTATLDGTQAAVVMVREDGTVVGHLVSAATASPTS